MNRRAKAYWGIIFTVLIWGLSFLSIKVVLQAFPPMSQGLLRFLIAVAALWLLKRQLAPQEKIRGRDLRYAAGAGLVGVTCYFFCENNGLSLLSASESSIVIATIPVLTVLADRMVFKTPVVRRQYGGALLSMLGVWMLVIEALRTTGNAAGYLYMFGSALCWVGYCFLTRPLFSRYSRITIVFYQSLFGLIGFLPMALIEICRHQWGTPTPVIWANLIFLGVFCSAIGYYLYATALNELGMGVGTIFVNLIPVVTVIAGFLILGEHLSPLQMAGGAVVIGGVWLATVETDKSKK
jgi:drug/metabolite transporter (DMT)-like permease